MIEPLTALRRINGTQMRSPLRILLVVGIALVRSAPKTTTRFPKAPSSTPPRAIGMSRKSLTPSDVRALLPLSRRVLRSTAGWRRTTPTRGSSAPTVPSGTQESVWSRPANSSAARYQLPRHRSRLPRLAPLDYQDASGWMRLWVTLEPPCASLTRTSASSPGGVGYALPFAPAPALLSIWRQVVATFAGISVGFGSRAPGAFPFREVAPLALGHPHRDRPEERVETVSRLTPFSVAC